MGGAVSLQSESGEGRALEPAADGTYLIYTAENLKEFAAIVNGTDDNSADPGANAKLMNDIDLSSVCGPELNDGTSWEPIGYSESTAYSGTFDGANYTISGLTINNSRANYQGLFGYVSGSGKVQNLSVSGSVSGFLYVGGIAGQNGGRITDCAFSGSVSGVNTVGGVVGYNSGNVENCYNISEVSGNQVGGVVGYNGGTVENCHNTGTVSDPDSGTGNRVGGVVGWNISSGNVTNCYNTGKVTGSGDRSNVGGVVGWNISSGNVTNCYNTGTVTGSGDRSNVGGVVGDNYGSVTNCYFLSSTAASGIGNKEDAEGAAVVDDLSDQDQFKDWDFIDTWRISKSLNRPVLQANAEDNALSGTGKQEDPYKIYRAIDLKNFRDLVNGKDGQTADPDAHAKLMNNIDLNGNATNQWTPIGTSSKPYSGTFDGANYTISGLYIDSSDTDYKGLFGFVGSEGTVQNLTVTGSVKGDDYVGGVVGDNRGRVENCHNIGEVSGNQVGGVVGRNSGNVENCYNTVSVSGNWYVGGVVGLNSGPRQKLLQHRRGQW